MLICAEDMIPPGLKAFYLLLSAAQLGDVRHAWPEYQPDGSDRLQAKHIDRGHPREDLLLTLIVRRYKLERLPNPANLFHPAIHSHLSQDAIISRRSPQSPRFGGLPARASPQ